MSRKVKSKKQAKPNIVNNKNVKNEFKIILENEDWLRSCSIRRLNFTNMYNDYQSMAQTLTKIMTVLLPDIQKNGYDIFNKNSIYHSRKDHCHIVAEDKLNNVENIINELYDNKLDVFSDEEKKLWQYGVNSGIRIICVYDRANNHVIPLFIDPHHLIHPDVKHNQNDEMTNKLCPVKTFNENSSS